jgi:DNA-binding SARP family transcriptional activator
LFDNLVTSDNQWAVEEFAHVELKDGRLCAAEAYLSRREWGQSQNWLRCALQTAPWLEKGWQLLMRLHARQGQRALALKTYQDAVMALEQELGIRPSELTVWLGQKVENEEPI